MTSAALAEIDRVCDAIKVKLIEGRNSATLVLSPADAARNWQRQQSLRSLHTAFVVTVSSRRKEEQRLEKRLEDRAVVRSVRAQIEIEMAEFDGRNDLDRHEACRRDGLRHALAILTGESSAMTEGGRMVPNCLSEALALRGRSANDTGLALSVPRAESKVEETQAELEKYQGKLRDLLQQAEALGVSA